MLPIIYIVTVVYCNVFLQKGEGIYDCTKTSNDIRVRDMGIDTFGCDGNYEVEGDKWS